MAHPLDIRPVEMAELPVLLDFVQAFHLCEVLPYEVGAATRILRALLETPAYGKAFFVREGGERIGYGIVTIGYSVEFLGRDAFIDELFLIEKYRGQGRGGQVIAHLEAYCRAEGIEALHLEVDHKNPKAAGLYRKSGFRAHERALMTKWLKPGEPR